MESRIKKVKACLLMKMGQIMTTFMFGCRLREVSFFEKIDESYFQNHPEIIHSQQHEGKENVVYTFLCYNFSMGCTHS